MICSRVQSDNVRFGSKADIGASVKDVRFTPKSGHNGARKRPSCTGHSFGVAEVLDCRRLRALLAPPSPTLARRCRTARPTGFCLGTSAQAPMIGTAAIRQSLPLARMARTGAGVAGDRVEPHVCYPSLSLDLLGPQDARVRTGV